MRNLSTAPPLASAGVLNQLSLERMESGEIPEKEKNPQTGESSKGFKLVGLPEPTRQENHTVKEIVFQQENSLDSSVLASEIFNLINRKPRIVRLHLCAGCSKHKSLAKFSAIPQICRACVQSAKVIPPRARARFIDNAKENLHKKLSSMLGGCK